MSTLADLFLAAPSAQILNEGYELDVDDTGVEGNIRFWVSGADVANFRKCVAGYPPTTITIFGASVSRLIPLAHPYEYNCYAYSLKAQPAPGSVSGLDTFGTGISFQDWFVDVGFRTPRYDYTGTAPLVTQTRQGSVDMVTRPGGAYYFPSDGVRPNHDCGVPVYVVNYSLVFHRLPALDNSLYDSLAGCVGATGTTFYGYPGENILYLGCSSSGEFSLGGFPSYEATQQFIYRSIPHNAIMRPDGAGFEAPVQLGDPTKFLLPTADLTALYGS